MNDQTTTNAAPPVPPSLPKKRSWRWLQITVGVILGFVLLGKILLSFNSPDLELTRRGYLTADDGHVLEIINVGKSATKISSITINDRSDCAVDREPTAQAPTVLNIGDKKKFLTACRIVRALVKTDHGSGTYSFNR
jgi:hypothetical protein